MLYISLNTPALACRFSSGSSPRANAGASSRSTPTGRNASSRPTPAPRCAGRLTQNGVVVQGVWPCTRRVVPCHPMTGTPADSFPVLQSPSSGYSIATLGRPRHTHARNTLRRPRTASAGPRPGKRFRPARLPRRHGFPFVETWTRARRKPWTAHRFGHGAAGVLMPSPPTWIAKPFAGPREALTPCP